MQKNEEINDGTFEDVSLSGLEFPETLILDMIMVTVIAAIIGVTSWFYYSAAVEQRCLAKPTECSEMAPIQSR